MLDFEIGKNMLVSWASIIRFVDLDKIVRIFLIIFLLLISNGCSYANCCLSFPLQGEDNSIHYLIIGVGIVSVPKPETETAILATKLQSLGATISDQPGLKLGIGYSSSTVVAVPNGAEDVRVEISQKPGQPLKVDVQKAKLTSNKQ